MRTQRRPRPSLSFPIETNFPILTSQFFYLTIIHIESNSVMNNGRFPHLKYLPLHTARVDSLKQLNRSLLVKLVQLTKVLVESPSDYEEKVKELKAVILNFQYLLNQYRPHEARETIITMLEKQLERRKEVSKLLKERIAAADTKIDDAKSRLEKQLSRLDTEVIPPSSEGLLQKSQRATVDALMDVSEDAEAADGAPELDLIAGLDFLLPQLAPL